MEELKNRLDSSWTLFLDRDGVINVRPYQDYVKTWSEFEFLPGVTTALKIFAELFERILIVTNQQGIAKNLMTPRDLYIIHDNMKKEIVDFGGRIDAIYYCPDHYTKLNHCRKPSIKMAKWAKRDFPEIDYKKSIMVGDTANDMRFGRKINMNTIFIGDDLSEVNESLIDYSFPGLIEFANSIAAID